MASTEPVFVDPATAAIANGVSPAARSRATASATAAPRRWNRSSDGMTTSVSGGKPSSSSDAGDREMGLVGGVDADALEHARRAARGPAPSSRPEVDVAGERHAHEVGHHAARREQPERARPVADEVAQPADDLLLDERRERSGVPDVDALVGHLGQQLAHDRDRQRRRREVAELARVLRVHQAAGDPRRELVEDRRGRGGRDRAPRPARRVVAEVGRAEARRSRAGSPIARWTAVPYRKSSAARQVASPSRSMAARDAASSR